MVNMVHIHCSSRFDRSAASLEAALDDWMSRSELITLTEVRRDYKANKLAEKGWGYYNSKRQDGSDECAIGWKLNEWSKVWGGTIRLSTHPFYEASGRRAQTVYAAAVVLKHKKTGQTGLITVAHLPAHVEDFSGNGHWRDNTYRWTDRKIAYQESMRVWSAWLEKEAKRRKSLDFVIVAADFNFNLKDDWARQYLKNHWGKLELRLAWKDFPTRGTHANGRIIDADYYKGLRTDGSDLLARDPSSDHTAYRTVYRLPDVRTPAKPLDPGEDKEPTTGDTKPGDPWWGFGDYDDDEIFHIDDEQEQP